MNVVPRGDIVAILTPCPTPEAPAKTPPVIGPARFAWHFHDGESFTIDIAWTYLDPLHEAAALKDHLCFHVDRPT